MNYRIDYGRTEMVFDIDPANVICEVTANDVHARSKGEDEVKRALLEPIGTLPLSDILQKGEKVCIVTSDITRPCPSHLILPPLVDEIIRAGINPEEITVVFALGSHRRHTEEEMRKITGDNIYDLVHTIDSDPEDVVLLGYTSRGTPVNITSSVASADRRICVGNIEMHYFAGYSGGAKAIMPGVSDRSAIQANHRMMIEETSAAGKIEGNNIRLDIEEAGDICGIDFILNVVLDENKDIVYAVAGDHRKAHREGCRFLDRMYKVRIPRRADIVIATPGGFPKDLNLYQAQKALDNAKHAVREGGIIILAAECPEGLGEDVFADWLNEAECIDDLITRVKTDFRLGGHKAAAIAMVAGKCSEIHIVSSMDTQLAAKTFMIPFDTINNALIHAFDQLGHESKVIIMPHAASTLPEAIDIT